MSLIPTDMQDFRNGLWIYRTLIMRIIDRSYYPQPLSHYYQVIGGYTICQWCICSCKILKSIKCLIENIPEEDVMFMLVAVYITTIILYLLFKIIFTVFMGIWYHTVFTVYNCNHCFHGNLIAICIHVFMEMLISFSIHCMSRIAFTVFIRV